MTLESPSTQTLLPRRALGRTGIVAPVLGFGVSGPLAMSLIRDANVHRLVHDAAGQGIEFFDTAPFYGHGRAENRLGNALATIPKFPAFISTKGGTRRVGGQYIKDFTIEGLTAQIAESRMRLPRIDAFFLHGPSADCLRPHLLDALTEMKAQGLFRFLGITGRGNELDTAIESQAFDLIMAPAHRNLPTEELDRLERARTQGLGVIGIECMAPAAHGPRLSLRPTDLWYTARALLRDRPAADKALSPAECLRWPLASGIVDIALITTTKHANLKANIAVAQNS